MDTQSHWQHIYQTKAVEKVSWYESDPVRSLGFIDQCHPDRTHAIIDIGAGTSFLSQRLLETGFQDVTALDVSDSALALAKQRSEATGRALEHAKAAIQWRVADIKTWQPERCYDIWHDRAVLHFLTDAEGQAAYVKTLRAALSPGGYAIISVFSKGGPTHCSGIAIQQYDLPALQSLLGPEFTPVMDSLWTHKTPNDADQLFQTALFKFQPD